MTDAEFGLEIKAARERKGWLQRELALRLHRKAPVVCAWERGHAAPQRDDVRLMVRVFDDWAFNLAVGRYYTESVLGFRYNAIAEGRAVAAMMVELEMRDVAQAMEVAKAAMMVPPQDEVREVAEALCLELLEAKAAINEQLLRLTHAHGISAASLAVERHKRAVSKGFAIERKNGLVTQAA